MSKDLSMNGRKKIETIQKEFTEKFSKAMSSLVMAPGMTEGAQLGASVSIKERNKIAELVDLAIKGGAKIETGAVLPSGPGAFYPATVLTVEKSILCKVELLNTLKPAVMSLTEEPSMNPAYLLALRDNNSRFLAQFTTEPP